MRRLALLGILLAALFAAAPAAASEWHSEQPVGSGLGVPVPLGEIGDVEFSAPNHGVLITAGNDAISSGLYAYDGSGWYPYATVCGGHEGRIAWSGPDDFWTISDQQRGQAVTEAGPISRTYRISLCHFLGGKVVASFAKPIGTAGSYPPLAAAACNGPSDCWFAGEKLPGTVNRGAFHLHWNGQVLTEVPSLTVPQPAVRDPGRSVTSLAFQNQSDGAAHLYEGVVARPSDQAPEETGEPSLVHEVTGGGGFRALFPAEPLELGAEGSAEALGPLLLTGAGDGLWAVAGSTAQSTPGVVLRIDPEGALRQVALGDPAEVLAPGNAVATATTEPGTNSLWIGYRRRGDELGGVARVAQVRSDGSIEEPVELPAEGEGIGPKGPASAIACPAQEQCWLATLKGWLFHRGGALPVDPDPALHTLIASRPADESIPFVPPVSLPEDNSGAYGAYGEAKEPSGGGEPFPTRRRHPALVANVKSHVVDHDVLVLSFVLHAKAHVRLVASRKGKVVARTKRYTFEAGRHTLRLRLDPKHWPTKLDLQAHPVAKPRPKK